MHYSNYNQNQFPNARFLSNPRFNKTDFQGNKIEQVVGVTDQYNIN